jgi:hypothetical protein
MRRLDLNPIDEFDAGITRSGRSFRKPVNRVVIRQGNRRQVSASRQFDHFRGRIPAVRGRGMQV